MRSLRTTFFAFMLIVFAHPPSDYQTVHGVFLPRNKNDDAISKHPYQVSVRVFLEGRLASTCGGAIVASRHFVTAGKCIEICFVSNKTCDLRTRVGSSFLDQGGQVRQGFRGLDVPKSFKDMEDNIGLISLDEALVIENITQLVQLPAKQISLYAGQVVEINGWGMKYGNNTDPLVSVNMTVLGKRKCLSALKNMGLKESQTVFCLDKSQANSSWFYAGTPLVVNSDEADNTWSLVGIVAFDPPPVKHFKPITVLTNVSLYADLIKRTIARHGD